MNVANIDDLLNDDELLGEGKEEDIKLYRALERLLANEDFKYVIMNNYLNKKVIRNVKLLGMYQASDTANKLDIYRELEAVSCLDRYLRIIINAGQEYIKQSENEGVRDE